MKVSEAYSHRAHVPIDDGEPIVFKWHWPRGVLAKRMSGLELSGFILNQMAAILGMGILSDHPRIEDEFRAMFVKLATEPRAVLDELLTWIRVEYHQEEDDIIYLSLFDRRPQAEGPIYSCP